MNRFVCFALMLFLSVPAFAMDLGTNFWNLGWHNPSDCFQNVKEVRGDNPWNPQFLKEISIYSNLRFMDWGGTNGSPRKAWSERTPKDAPRQIPAAYEWMIDLCNRTNADMWVTLPHLTVNRDTGDAPADYALRLCILVKTGVDMQAVDLTPMMGRLATMTQADFIQAGGVKTCEPLRQNLRLYVEYSNETWNGMFRQAHYTTEEGEALGLDQNKWTAGFRFHAWAAIRLFRAANLVFGEGNPRVVRVLAGFTSNPWIARQHLQVMNDPKLNPWKTKADAIATAPYFGHKVDGSAADAVEQLRADIQKSISDSQKHKQIADEAKLRLIAYEGGQHVTKNAQGINRDPAMHALYVEYLQAMRPFFDLFSHYCHVGQAGQGGAWGCIERTGQPLEAAHKYRALVEYAAERRKRL